MDNIRVYGINLWEVKGEGVNVADFSDNQFIAEAKRQGLVWTLKEFEDYINSLYGVDDLVIKIVDISHLFEKVI